MITLQITPEVLEQIILEQGPEFKIKLGQAVLENVINRSIKAVIPGNSQAQIEIAVREQGKKIITEVIAAINSEDDIISGRLGEEITLLKRAITRNAENIAMDMVNKLIPSLDEYVGYILDRKETLIKNEIKEEIIKLVGEELKAHLSVRFEDKD